MSIRVRYAPSPTGLQHIGGVRTALFNYLFARSAEAEEVGAGAFILRLEDTDRTRCADSFVQNIYDTFDWLGFRWDEGPDKGGKYAPYIQSERTALYQKYAGDLLAAGAAYRCFCSSERLESVRKEREAAKSPLTGYDRLCRALSADEAERRAKAGEPFTVRLRIPLDEAKTHFNDALLGEVVWKNADINPDPVLIKSDGFPTYHLANVVDDHLMGISHVLRAQEWLSSTPLHIILYNALGWEPPLFCHLPMVMGADGKKLSKRHGATSLDEFRNGGYLPEALINYVAMLGASYEEGREIWSLEELAARFSLDKLKKSEAVFDYKKLGWFNAEYIRAKTNAELAALAMPFAAEDGLFGKAGQSPSAAQKTLFENAMPLVRERAALLTEIPPKLRFLFIEPPVAPIADFIPKKGAPSESRAYLEKVLPLIEKLCFSDEAEFETIIKEESEKCGAKHGDFLTPLRAAVTGSRVSPPLALSMRLLGSEVCTARVKRALETAFAQ